MALKIISLLFIASLAFGIQNPSQIKDMPFDVNNVINQISPYHSQNPNSQPLTTELPNYEFLLDTNIVYRLSLGQEESPAIAFDGTNYLVVWQDNRDHPSSRKIYGTRVNQTGEVLDKGGIQITTSPYTELSPSVSFNGINYLVVWQDNRNGNWDIYGSRVNQSGIVLDTIGFMISNVTNSQNSPSVASNGIDYFVVWEDGRNGSYYNIYGARVSQTGEIIDTMGINISSLNFNQYSTSVAFDGSNYLVVWYEQHGISEWDIYGARVTQYGLVLDPEGIAISTDTLVQAFPSVSFDGSNYLVVWEDYRNRNYDIYGARVTQAGITLDTNGIIISNYTRRQRKPSIAFDGTNFLVVWEDDRDYPNTCIYGSRIDTAGIVIDTNDIIVSPINRDQSKPCLSFDSTNYCVIWQKLISEYNTDIIGNRINQSGVILDSTSISISITANRQDYPSIASDGSNYFIVWTDYRNSDINLDIYGLRLNEFGAILDSSDIAISTTSNGQLLPSVVFGGTNYFVVWTDRNGSLFCLYGARINQNGILLDTNGILISSSVWCEWRKAQLATAFDGFNYFVVWLDSRNIYFDIYGARINQAGVVLDPEGIRISPDIPNTWCPAIAYDGTNYLVVWQNDRFGGDIYGARVCREGEVLDSIGFAITNTANYKGEPSVAFDGNNYLVAWKQGRGDSSDIYGARVSPDGVVIDTIGFSISTARYSQYQLLPALAFDGVNYIVVWQEHRVENSSIISDIYGAKVNTSGFVIDSFPVSTQPKNQSSPKMAKGIDNQVLVVYSGWAGTIQGKTYDETRIWGNFSPFGGIAEENSKVKMQSAKLLEVYPNPAKSYFTIRLPQTADRQNLKIFDVSGKMIKEIEILRGVYPASFEKRDCFAGARNDKRCGAQNDRAGDIKISLKGINPGIYFLRFGKETKKFLVVK
jgi:hypothetical protein